MILGAVASLGLAACQHAPADMKPAALVSTDADTLAAVSSVLAEAVGRAQVTLGPLDPDAASILSVLPPAPSPAEDRSLARPVLFDVMVRDGACYAVARDTGTPYLLDGVDCR